jgi:acetyltransferase
VVPPARRRGVPIEELKPPAYPWHLARERVLPDGRPVLVRPIHPDDAPHEASFLAHLSPQARENRFQRLAGPEQAQLARFYTRIDYDEHMAYVCTARENGVERIVGDARYFAHPDRRGCEFGIVVADDWHHTGVAQLLMRELMAHAKDRGFRSMASLVLSDNRAMLDFAAALGFRVEALPHDPARVRIARAL